MSYSMEHFASSKTAYTPQASTEAPLSLGKPRESQGVSQADCAIGLGCCIAAILALITVFDKAIAIALGQTYQLVAVGFLLSMMALCAQRQVQKFLLLWEIRHGHSTLQNLDAILRSEYFASQFSWQPRIGMWFTLLLPLGLAVAYKTFTSGATERSEASPNMLFGLTAAPGYQRIGNGLSLMINAYLPFWLHPAIGRTYGFNLYVMDNMTSAIIDAPLPDELIRLQASLGDSESRSLTVNVSATVAENIPLTESERDSDSYWKSVRAKYVDDSRMTDTGAFSANGSGRLGEGIWAGQRPRASNFTEIYISRWDTSKQETFESQAERFISTRRNCTATWHVTKLNVTLTNVTNLQSAAKANSNNQSAIQNLSLNLGDIFLQLLGEFQWTARDQYNDPLPDSSFNNPVFSPKVNSRTPLVASMLWSRLVSFRGPERGPESLPELAYQRSSEEINQIKRVQTLRASWWLGGVIVVQLFVTLLALVGKWQLSGVPVTDDFGLISLMAALTLEGLNKLKGAALSGKLSKSVRVQLVVDGESQENTYKKLSLNLDHSGESDILEERQSYG